MKFARILAALALSAVVVPAFAQYPNKPIKVIVPFPAGSATDTITRILSNSVSQSIGQTLAHGVGPGVADLVGNVAGVKGRTARQ